MRMIRILACISLLVMAAISSGCVFMELQRQQAMGRQLVRISGTIR